MGLELQREAGELRTDLRDVWKGNLTPLELILATSLKGLKCKHLKDVIQILPTGQSYL